MRVFEIDPPDTFFLHKTACRGFGWSQSLNSRPPIITRVCQESRAVAFETGRIEQGDWPGDRTRVNNQWLNPTTDIAALYWDEPIDIHMYGDDDPIPELFRYAPQCQGALITSGRFYPWDRVRGPIMHHETLARLKEYFVCLEIVMIHATREEMLNSELFGQLGEEYCQLIDPYDSQTLQKFYQLSNGVGAELSETKLFFHLALDTESFQAYVNEWAEDTITLWVWEEWEVIWKHEFAGIPEPENIWLGPRMNENGPLSMLKPITYYGPHFPCRLDLERFSANKQHPWVREILFQIPKFHPRIMFRPCIKTCWVKMERDPPGRGRYRRPGSR